MTVFKKRLKHVDIDLNYTRGLGKKDYVFQLLSIKCHNTWITMCKFTKHYFQEIHVVIPLTKVLSAREKLRNN